MCGLAGFYNPRKVAVDHPESLLHAMHNAIAHRGPDGAQIWYEEQHGIGFAHRRLSIIDLSNAGTQPMSNADGSVTIIYNGEIYNHREIRAELEARGYRYVSQSDTETIIHAYTEWGIDFLHRLEGMFALALFDKTTEELYLIRDRSGIKPLYFSLSNGIISFASEIKALWQLPWMTVELSTLAAYHYLTFMVAPAPYTLYQGVYKLPASFYAKVDRHGSINFVEWYSPVKPISYAERREFDNEQFCIDGVRRLMRDSVKRRMIADVPVGTFLSGGVDSSLNVALMAETGARIKTFTVAFSDGPEFNELYWARAVAKKFGTEHHEITISEKESFELYEKMVYQLDEPLADCVCVPFYYVSKLAHDHGIKVVQVGEGADELFFGYDIYAKYLNINRSYLKGAAGFIPATARRMIYQGVRSLMPNKSNHVDLIYNWAHNRDLFWGGAIAFNEHQKRSFLGDLMHQGSSAAHDPIVAQIYPGMRQEFDSYAIVDYHLNELKKIRPDADFATQLLYLEVKQRLPELLLMRADKMSMAQSLEGRVPFLDHNLVEFAFNIPGSLKFKNGQTKYILKKACEGIIPNEVIYRKKMGFAAPIVRWFNAGNYFPGYFANQARISTSLSGELRSTQPSHKASAGTAVSGVESVGSSYNQAMEQHRYETSPYNSAVQHWTIQNLMTTIKKTEL